MTGPKPNLHKKVNNYAERTPNESAAIPLNEIVMRERAAPGSTDTDVEQHDYVAAKGGADAFGLIAHHEPDGMLTPHDVLNGADPQMRRSPHR